MEKPKPLQFSLTSVLLEEYSEIYEVFRAIFIPLLISYFLKYFLNL